MTTRIFALFLGFWCGLVTAQESKHLLFKGIPLDGTLNEYVAKLKLQGLTYVKTDNKMATFSGEFASYKDCYLGIMALNQSDLVYKAVVLFPKQETWSKLSSNYFELKVMLTEKYGEPTEVLEQFEPDDHASDDFMRINMVRWDQCKYRAIWSTEKGDIQLSIDHVNGSDCFVKLGYIDKLNGVINKSKAIDDL